MFSNGYYSPVRLLEVIKSVLTIPGLEEETSRLLLLLAGKLQKAPLKETESGEEYTKSSEKITCRLI